MNFKDFAKSVREGRDLPKLKLETCSDSYYKETTVIPPKGNSETIKKSKNYVQDALDNHSIFKNDVKSDFSLMSQVDDVSSVCESDMKDESFERCQEVYRQYKFQNNTSNLRVHKIKDTIVSTILSNRVTIIKGETGCGKTTQIPQFILDCCRERNIYSKIIVTQPRRIAAITVAKRVCEERNWPVGSVVGYQVSLDKEVSQDTRLIYCTAGILLQNLVLKKATPLPYSHIFIDEVHERNDETDFLLIVLKMLLARNQNLKLILMSATIDTEKFVKYFSDPCLDPKRVVNRPPVICVDETTQFKVDIYNLDSFKDFKVLGVKRPNMDFDDPRITNDLYKLAANLIEHFYKLDDGEKMNKSANGVLIFLPGMYEIDSLMQILESKKMNLKNDQKWFVCPLHSMNALEDQIKVFQPPPNGMRKIILATNIAESSLTVPDVKYVIDFCLSKIQIQKGDTNYTSLELGWISKSQAAQRAGRVGRVSSGRVYRLVPQSFYDQFEDNCTPEILRCPLESLVLKTKQLDLGSPAVILAHAMDPPDLENINRTVTILKEIGALRLKANGVYKEDDGDLTSIGLVMSNLPFDPIIAKLIIIGHFFDCLDDCVIMACAMSVKNLFTQPLNREMESYNSKFNFARSSFSDPIAFLNVYKTWKEFLATGRFRKDEGFTEWKWCQRNFIQLRSLKEVQRLEDEAKMRLNNLNINLSGNKRRFLKDEEKSLILKIVLAGASYPNYFLKSSIDEVEAVRDVGGYNPNSTVYLKNFPIDQPKQLYVESIKNKFLNCTSDEKDIKVLFDGSTKIYIQFQNTFISCKGQEKQAMMPLYRAIKMFQLKYNIEIPLLPVQEARSKAKEVFGEDFEDTMKNPLGSEKLSTIPGLGSSVMSVFITEINDPNDFWIQPIFFGKRLDQIRELVQDKTSIEKVKRGSLKIGDLCVAPYSEQHEIGLYRAKVLSIDGCSPRRIQVFYIDYGNKNYLVEDEIFTFTELGLARGLKTEPPLAIHCSLAKIQPSFSKNPDRIWSHKVKSDFMNQFADEIVSLKIYSVVDSTMKVHLYKSRYEQDSSILDEGNSYNNYLIDNGLAEPAEEPYLSRENHMMRENAQVRPECASHLSTNARLNIEKVLPLLDEFSSNKARLKGPYSPLEMVWNGVSAKNLSLKVTIDRNSVNSVLLDDNPMDHHERFLVAGNISQGNTNKVLTLRNTTLMPNIHGLYYICAMIFAPRVELRHDQNRHRYIGALCGLGYDKKTKKAYFPENDLELKFDTEIDNEDILTINKVRYYINYAVNGEDDKPTCYLNEHRILTAKEKINQLMMRLLTKSRKSIPLNNYCPSSYCWGEGFDPHYKLQLRPEDKNEEFILPMIYGFNLNQTGTEDRFETIVQNLKTIDLHVKGTQTMRTPIKCELCNEIFATVKALKMHVYAIRHTENQKNFFAQTNK